MRRLLSVSLLPVAAGLLALAALGPGWTQAAAAASGASLLVIAALLLRVPPQVGVSVVATVWVVSGLGLALWNVSDTFRYRVRTFVEGPQGVGIWRTDDRYGYTHIPGVTGRHVVAESFDVVYTIDASGCRATPTPERPRKRVLFLGGSVTFGHGVAAGQSYPGVLAHRYWPNAKVKNCSVGGWGTAQAYLKLEDELASGPVPDVVLYGWTQDHLRRNYIKRGWVTAMAAYGRRHPWFDIERGNLVYHGTIGPEGSVPPNPRTSRRSIRVTIRLLTGMHDMARAAGARFALIRMGSAVSGRADTVKLGFETKILAAVRKYGVVILDAREARGAPLPFDFHPDARWHAEAAALLAALPALRDLSE
ncbi:MAG: hypothetical protein JRG76_15540 [Deltaproteobacteria bacterium]|nr:hypothetical protein [Deltaproteobacteria bacterium]MBW2415912.1 hypothetical protein [Deltaproteobacteria bacterium]